MAAIDTCFSGRWADLTCSTSKLKLSLRLAASVRYGFDLQISQLAPAPEDCNAGAPVTLEQMGTPPHANIQPITMSSKRNEPRSPA
ncbi:hypothetical protein DHEL01_v201992 [Diaporthe helianthi]|uniref:Uncharacterized protein n=1 Tax=Diaporthe helianthi TaxID=158607 RepID=A0A2P5IAV4_DIAHE|nr:hypothetical protein DHEL01_v201992 [Diaporthe helianthi]